MSERKSDSTSTHPITLHCISPTPRGAAVGAAKAGLIQNAAVSYQQNVQPRFEAGSHELYWLTGQAMGSVQVGRLIGDRGILDGVVYGNDPNNIKKGLLGGIEFKIGRLGLAGITVKQEVIMLSGCVLSAYGISFNVGGLEVQESMTIQTALLKRGLQVGSGAGGLLSTIINAAGAVAGVAGSVANLGTALGGL